MPTTTPCRATSIPGGRSGDRRSGTGSRRPVPAQPTPKSSAVAGQDDSIPGGVTPRRRCTPRGIPRPPRGRRPRARTGTGARLPDPPGGPAAVSVAGHVFCTGSISRRGVLGDGGGTLRAAGDSAQHRGPDGPQPPRRGARGRSSAGAPPDGRRRRLGGTRGGSRHLRVSRRASASSSLPTSPVSAGRAFHQRTERSRAVRCSGLLPPAGSNGRCGPGSDGRCAAGHRAAARVVRPMRTRQVPGPCSR